MKKILSVILVLSMVFGICSLMASAESGWTLAQMQAQFPHGKYWNHLCGSGHYYNEYTHSGNCGDVMMTVTDRPCYSHNANASAGQYDCNTYYNSGIQCNGFARLLADLAYPGATDIYSWGQVYDKGTAISVVKPGDVIHYKGAGADATWGHWVFVTGVSGSTVTLGECNVGDKCNIYWGRTLNLWNVSSLTLYRAPYQWNSNPPQNPTYDVNGNLDGNSLGATTGFATFDVYIGGILVADDVADYCTQHTAGTAFEIKDVKAVGCHEQAGEPNVVYGSDGAITVTLNFKTSHTLNDGEITIEPTCTEKGEKTVSCVNCDYNSKTEVEPLGHDYKKTKIDATCTENAKFVYICSRCNNSYVESVSEDDIWSEWSEEKPNVAEDKIETKTQYRYMQRETKVTNEAELVGWVQTGKTWSEGVKTNVDYVTNWHWGFDKNNALYNQYNKTAPTSSETANSKVEVGTPAVKGYIYWHWCCSTYNGKSPINRYISDCYGWDNSTNRTYDVFHAFFSTEAKGVSNTGAVDFYNSAACNQTYWWQPAITVMSVPVTTYEMMYEYYKDTEYSEWLDELPELPENTRTETRTLYRYVVDDDLLKGHSWDNGTVQGDMIVYTCSSCGETKSEKYEAPAFILGDVNCDGKITAADARLALRASAKLETLTDVQFLAGDVNKDGKVNAADARIILRVAAKLQSF